MDDITIDYDKLDAILEDYYKEQEEEYIKKGVDVKK